MAAIVLMLCGTSARGQQAATRPAGADAYLDVCVAAIEQWPTPDSPPRTAGAMHSVAASLIYARGSDRDRGQARRMLIIPFPRSPNADAAEQASGEWLFKLHLKAALGEGDALHDEIGRFAAARPPPRLSLGEPFDPPATLDEGLLYGLIGRDERAVECIGDGVGLRMGVPFLAEAGRDALVDRLLPRMTARREASNCLAAARILCARGRFDAAFSAIDLIAHPGVRAQTFASLSFMLDETGKADAAAQAFARAMAAWDKVPTRRPAALSPLDWIDRGDDARTRAAWSRWQWSAGSGKRVTDRVTVGRCAAAFGPRSWYESAMASACAAPPVGDDGFADASLAVLLAADGRPGEAIIEFDRLRAVTPTAVVWPGQLIQITSALCRAGAARAAIELIDHHVTDPVHRETNYASVATALARAGDFDGAWALVGRIQSPGSSLLLLRARLNVLLALDRAGRRVEALAKLATVVDAVERAELALYLARDLMGTRLVGEAGATVSW